jgi:hypothetical protein
MGLWRNKKRRETLVYAGEGEGHMDRREGLGG